jgi:hypothetical protein
MNRRPRRVPRQADERWHDGGDMIVEAFNNAGRRRPRVDFFEADDHRGTWAIREHSQLKRQWRFIRRLPVMVQIIIAQFALTWFVFVFCLTWLVVGGLTMPP